MIDSLEIILGQMFKNSFEVEVFQRELANAGTAPPDVAPEVRFGKVDPEPMSPCLNVTLVDLRENRKLRSNDRISVGSGAARHTAAKPANLDCHFIATAWVKPNDPEKDVFLEHSLLYFAASALLRNNPLIPRLVFGLDDVKVEDRESDEPGFDALSVEHRKFVQAIDPVLRDRELPIDALPPDGYPKLAEFFGLLGLTTPIWQPSVYFIVTIPIEQPRRLGGPIVRSIETTIVNQSGKRFNPDAPDVPLVERETFACIDGRVTDTTAAPVEGMRIELTLRFPPPGDGGDPRGRSQATSTGTDGHYRFALLPEAVNSPDCTWEIRAGEQAISGSGPLVPQHSYDIQLTETL